jgi:hypothetical protein
MSFYFWLPPEDLFGELLGRFKACSKFVPEDSSISPEEESPQVAQEQNAVELWT